MRKFFAIVLTAVMSVTALATNYTGNLTVQVNGEGSTQNATIAIDENTGKYTLTLRNFILVSGTSQVPVGNIVIDNIKGTTSNGTTMLYAERKIQIAPGDDDTQNWMGPMLGEVPIKMNARFNAGGYLVTSIDIDMQAALQQVIKVTFDNTGDHYQMPNAGFEEWTESTTEPKNWHGFKSAKGAFANFASSTLLQSEDVRPNAVGKYSAVLATKKVFSTVANGTMTNGQLSADAITATDPKNHAETDLSMPDKDKNGDPFYTEIFAAPDSVKLWVKFQQGTASTKYPNATFSAILTDGTYYQDPEDKPYTNVAAKAQNKKIETGAWREVSVPFDYQTFAKNNVVPQAILVTVSTNATPGQGSDNDQVWVDDIELVYDAAMSDLKYKGATLSGWNPATTAYTINDYQGVPTADDFTATLVGKAAVLGTVVETTSNAHVARISVVSADLKKATTYTINFPITALKGDVNRDGIVDVSDVTGIINMILGQAAQDLEVADMNSDGIIDVSDVTNVINMILSKQ